MVATVTRVRREGYLQRLGQSLAGVLVGIALIVGGCVLLFWNDGRAVEAERGLAAGGRAAVSLAAPVVDPAREGALVHLSGPVTSEAGVSDPDLATQFAGALVLVRTVEMYQWTETARSETRERVGGTRETTTTYNYALAWSDQPVQSSGFAQPEGHINPPMPVQSARLVADDAVLGGFALDGAVLAGLRDGQPVAPLAAPDGWRLEGGQLVRGSGTATAPRLGDVRVRYVMLPSGTVLSVMGRQSGATLAPWSGPGSRYAILLAREGTVPADRMIAQRQQSEQVLTWVLRLVGTALTVTGFALMLGPLSALANVLPPLANLLAGGAGLVALALGVPLSLLVIALAWLVFRPLVAGALVAAGLAVLVTLARRRAPRPGPQAVP